MTIVKAGVIRCHASVARKCEMGRGRGLGGKEFKACFARGALGGARQKQASSLFVASAPSLFRGTSAGNRFLITIPYLSV